MKSAFLIAALVATAAVAQTSALRGLDTSGPIDVDAARIEIQDNDNQAIFSGDVVIRQGKLTLKSDTVKISYTRTGDAQPQMQRLDARGNVVLISPSERATGNTGIYDVNGRLITLVGNVTLDRGGSKLQGQRLVINLASGQTSFDGRGGATPGASGATPGRVTGRFLVPEKGKKP
jgi:lipopolysaccharide export system protein LptA